MDLIFEKSRADRCGYQLPELDVPSRNPDDFIPADYLRRDAPDLPEISEIDAVRHFTSLSKRNFGVESGTYPLGSCTMKYNPKINEDVARIESFENLHPLQPEMTVQGALELMYIMELLLCEITGMDNVCLHPAAGAHGELLGLMLIKGWHNQKKDYERNTILVPDSAHGTNLASAAMLGYRVVEVKSNDRGLVDMNDFTEKANEHIAGFMLTNPNTLGMFEENIIQISEQTHRLGGLLYYDGANLNGIMGIVRPGDMGFDIVHLNLHKTFSTPHGSGGPGSGPIGVKANLAPYLPIPIIIKTDAGYSFDYDRPLSVGQIRSFYGNFSVIIKAYSYIISMGAKGLRSVCENAVLNANYLMNMLKKNFFVPYDRTCKHEFVISAIKQKMKGVSALDIAKRMLDFGLHPPTMYFPLIVKEAMMFEPTETESKENLDKLAEVMADINKEVCENPDIVRNAPHTTVVGRLDDVRAARFPKLRYLKDERILPV